MKFLGLMWFRLCAYLTYCWKAKSNRYLHSPFVFGWYRVIHEPIPKKEHSIIEQYRIALKDSNEILVMNEWNQLINTTISKRYTTTSISSQYGQVLYQTARYLKARNFLELGTSLGVSTLYLALSDSKMRGSTIDYQQSIVDYTKDRFSKFAIEGVEFIRSSFDDALPTIMHPNNTFDLVYIDGDHSYASTMKYVNFIIANIPANMVIILDDIRWSQGMYRAWQELIAMEQFHFTIDYGRIGLLFQTEFRSAKQHFVLK
jgi:predicted O-methyltransferase YrrM